MNRHTGRAAETKARKGKSSTTADATVSEDGAAGRTPPPRSSARPPKESPFPVLYARASDAAQIIRASRSKVYKLIESGDLPIRRIGGMLRIPVAALERFAKEAMENAD